MKKTVKLYFEKPVNAKINMDGGQFGDARHGRTHKGLDYSAPPNTDVKASEKGKVVYSGNRPYRPGGDNNLGNTIVIDHTDGVPEDQRHIYTVYAHLNTRSVSVDRKVSQGETIGASGNSGMKAAYEGKKSGFHLHFEVIDSATKMDWNMGWPRENRKNPIGYLDRITTVGYELPDDKKTGTGVGFPI
ncbi:MAG: M23 family metallopeptidase [Deltaproteobacteria bacterium]